MQNSAPECVRGFKKILLDHVRWKTKPFPTLPKVIMARSRKVWTRTTWHPTPGTEITATGHNFWLLGQPLVTVTGKVLGTGYCREGSTSQGISTPAVCKLHSDEYVGDLRGQMNDYVDALIEDAEGKRWRVTACMGEIEATEKAVHTFK